MWISFNVFFFFLENAAMKIMSFWLGPVWWKSSRERSWGYRNLSRKISSRCRRSLFLHMLPRFWTSLLLLVQQSCWIVWPRILSWWVSISICDLVLYSVLGHCRIYFGKIIGWNMYLLLRFNYESDQSVAGIFS